MRIRSIGIKLTLWYTSLLTISFLLLGGIAYGLLSYNLAEEIDASLGSVAEVIIEQSKRDGELFLPSEIDDIFRRFFDFPPLNHGVDIFDMPGRRTRRLSDARSQRLNLSPKALKNSSQGISTFETITTDGAYPLRVLTVPVTRGNVVTKLVQVVISLENMIRTRHRFLLIMASVLPLALLLSGGGGWLLARRVLKPVDRMTRTAERISEKRLNERLQETGNGDELDRLAKTLNHMLSRLDSAFDQMRQFSADASHELQTPLTILKGEMEVALRSPRNQEEYRHVLESGLEEIDKIDRLVEGLLLLARADSGALRMDLKPLELTAFTQNLCQHMQVIADKHGVTLSANLTPPVFVLADNAHLRRLILNLLDNAIKYTPDGGRVTLTVHGDKKQATVMITDTGIGLSPEEQKRIFDRFHRSVDTRGRDQRGVGLGLSIARSIAEAHGGKIEVQSKPNQGSSFSVHLPALPSFESPDITKRS